MNDPFYKVNLTTLIDLNLKEYSQIYYESLPKKKSKVIKMAFDYGFIWRTNKEKNLIIEYKLKDDEHLTIWYKINRPTFTDTTYFIQDFMGKFHIIEDTLNLKSKIDSVNQFERQFQNELPVKAQKFDKQNRLIQSRARDIIVKYDYDINSNLIRKTQSVVIKQNKDSIENILDEIRYEYSNNTLKKIKYYSEARYPYLADGLYRIDEYKYSFIRSSTSNQKNVDISTVTFHEISEKLKTKKQYTNIVGISLVKTNISWSNYNRISFTRDNLNDPRVKKVVESFTKE